MAEDATSRSSRRRGSVVPEVTADDVQPRRRREVRHRAPRRAREGGVPRRLPPRRASACRAASSRCRSRSHVPDKNDAHHRVLRGRHPLAARRPHPEGDGLHERRRRWAAASARWKNGGFPWVQDRAVHARAASRYSRHFLLPEVGEAGQAKLLDAQGALPRRRRPRLARRRSTWPRPASARSASSTTTSSTCRTCSARSCTPTTASACRRSSRPQQTHQGAQPRRQRDRAPRRASTRRTSWTSSTTTTSSSTAATTSRPATSSTTPAC